MQRRNFIKSLGAFGMTASIPASLTIESLISRAYAAGPDYSAVNYTPPALLPQVISIFLYGGASELSGNLSNIADINANSQNAYPAGLVLPFDPNNFNRNDPNSGKITPNNFWGGAGGVPLEFMLKYRHMSVYRTIMKKKEPTRSHRESIFMSLKGSLDIENTPGVGTRLAILLADQSERGALNGVQLADGRTVGAINGGLLGFRLPFVSFEGTTTAYAPDPDKTIDIRLKGLTLDEGFENPYSRAAVSYDSVINNLVQKVDAATASRFGKVRTSFALRESMAQFVSRFSNIGDFATAVPNATRDGFTVDAEDAAFFTNGVLQYPNTQFTDRIRSAVILAVENVETLYTTVGGGLGGWDDHNNGMDQYPNRMDDLMAVMRAAMLHIKYAGRSSIQTPLGGTPRRTDNIVINMYGDFGRLVNLNNSNGWDHANNQNLFTFGGAGVRSGGVATMGKIVGETVRVGTAGTNDQYTQPTSNSYTAEPMSISASLYSYFGVANPNVLTADPLLNPSGDPGLDETQASVPIAAASFV